MLSLGYLRTVLDEVKAEAREICNAGQVAPQIQPRETWKFRSWEFHSSRDPQAGSPDQGCYGHTVSVQLAREAQASLLQELVLDRSALRAEVDEEGACCCAGPQLLQLIVMGPLDVAPLLDLVLLLQA